MIKNQIKVRRIENGTTTFFTIKKGYVYDKYGKNNVYCGCTGKTVQTATPMQYDDTKGVYCPNCGVKKVEILQTYEEWKAEKDKEERRINEERLANLHIVEMGSDWECGFKYYGLSTQIDYDDWLKVKEHFRYYRKGWSRGQELEWNYGEPSGWLTRNPNAVEDILVANGLIKEENRMESLEKRAELERERRKAKLQANLEKRMEFGKKVDEMESKIKNDFDNDPNRRELSDAEANKHYFNASYGKGTVQTFDVANGEIIMCRNMGDFKYGVAVPYKEYLKQWIDNMYYFEKQMSKY